MFCCPITLVLFASIPSFFLPGLYLCISRPCWSTVSESTMLFYNLFLLMLFSFQLVTALPLPARGQRADHLEHLIVRQSDEPLAGVRPDHHPTQPCQPSSSQPTTSQPPGATVTTVQSINSYVLVFRD